MQMMFFYLFLLILLQSINDIKSAKQNINYDDDLFYGDPLSLKTQQLDKLKDQLHKEKQKPSKPNIKNLNAYFSNYNNQLTKSTDFIAKENGKCFNFYSFSDLFVSNKNKREIEDNLDSISYYLNDLNYFFKDEYGNLLVYSVCKNPFFNLNGDNNDDNRNYVKCFQRFIFISKIDFSYFGFSFSGEKIPSVLNFLIDFSVDEYSHKRVNFK